MTAMFMALVMLLSLSGAAAEGMTGLPNPWIDCENLEEAREVAGYDFPLPRMPEAYIISAIRVIEGELAEIVYALDDSTISYRVGPGSGDISGDYNEYEETRTEAYGSEGTELTYRGNEGRIFSITWEASGYSYALAFYPGLEEEDAEILTEILDSILNNDVLTAK